MNAFRAKLSQLKTRLYREPKDEIRRMMRWGPQAYFFCDTWARQMELAAQTLPLPTADAGAPALPVWFLTGRRFWYQTAFCAWTLANHSGRAIELNIVDDGSLEEQHIVQLRRLFPSGLTVTKESVRDRIDSFLRPSRFPILRQRWNDYVNIRKLTDIHVASAGVKLVLDSDMLFLRPPESLLAWWDKSQGSEIEDQGAISRNLNSDLRSADSAFSPCLMTDCEESYGYSRPLLERLAGAPIPSLLNVGICGLRSEDLDWEEIEFWCRALSENEGTSYYLEQALVAMLAARYKPTVMPRQSYITFPTQRQVQAGEGVLQHYVSDSKPWYFGQAWRRAMKLR